MSELAAEAAKLAAEHAFAEVRDQEHTMAVQAVVALKAQQHEDLARERAAREVAAALAHREQVLAAARENNARLEAELAHTMQVAQQTEDIESARVAAMAKAAEKEAAKVARAQYRDEALHLQLQGELAQVQLRLSATRTSQNPAGELKPAATEQPPKAQQHNAPALNCNTFSRGPEMTLKRRSEDPARQKPGRSPPCMSHHGDGREKEQRRAQRVSDADSLREAARAAVVVERRAQSPRLPFSRPTFRPCCNSQTRTGP